MRDLLLFDGGRPDLFARAHLQCGLEGVYRPLWQRLLFRGGGAILHRRIGVWAGAGRLYFARLGPVLLVIGRTDLPLDMRVMAWTARAPSSDPRAHDPLPRVSVFPTASSESAHVQCGITGGRISARFR